MDQSGGEVRSSNAHIELTSYREVFDLERRIYRIDRFRLNPSGIPLRGVLYFAIAAALSAVLDGMPAAHWLLGYLPWYLHYVGLPGLIATLGSTIRVEGRPLHLAMRGLALRVVRPKHLSAFRNCRPIGSRWEPPPIVVIPDGSETRPRRVRFVGPGQLVIRSPVEIVEWRRGIGQRWLTVPDLTIRVTGRRSADPSPGSGRALKLGQGVRAELEA